MKITHRELFSSSSSFVVKSVRIHSWPWSSTVCGIIKTDTEVEEKEEEEEEVLLKNGSSLDFKAAYLLPKFR